MSVRGADILQQLDWIREGWDNEIGTEQRLDRLGRYVEQIGNEETYQRARGILRLLRITNRTREQNHTQLLLGFQLLASDWEKRRPTPVTCGFDYGNGYVCQVAYRSKTRLEEHRQLVHDWVLSDQGV